MAAPRQLIRFGPFTVDREHRIVFRDGGVVDLPPRHVNVLSVLLERPGAIVPRQQIFERVWSDTAVTDSSLDQSVRALRRTLGRQADGAEIIVAYNRRGLQFAAPVEYVDADGASHSADGASHGDDARGVDIAGLLAPEIAFNNSRAALEALAIDRLPAVIAACRLVLTHPLHGSAVRIVLANALVLQFESTRADAVPSAEGLLEAERHAQEAVRLTPHTAEAWSVLAHVYLRLGRGELALAAARRAVALEPREWRCHLRLAFVAGGAERLRAAMRVLDLSPGNPLAHWLAATVFLARQSFEVALAHIIDGCEAQERLRSRSGSPGRVHAVGLFWLQGLVFARLGDLEAATLALRHELLFEQSGHVVAREVCASACAALGALHLRQEQPEAARQAFHQALGRVPSHGPSVAALRAMQRRDGGRGRDGCPGHRVTGPAHDPLTAAMTRAVAATLAGRPQRAAQSVLGALQRHAVHGPGALWVLAVDPFLDVASHPRLWRDPLARLLDLAS